MVEDKYIRRVMWIFKSNIIEGLAFELSLNHSGRLGYEEIGVCMCVCDISDEGKPWTKV